MSEHDGEYQLSGFVYSFPVDEDSESYRAKDTDYDNVEWKLYTWESLTNSWGKSDSVVLNYDSDAYEAADYFVKRNTDLSLGETIMVLVNDNDFFWEFVVDSDPDAKVAVRVEQSII